MIDYQVNAIHTIVLKLQYLWSIYQIAIQHCNLNVIAVLGLVERLVQLNRNSNILPYQCIGDTEIK